MKPSRIFLVLSIVALVSSARSQWVNTGGPEGSSVRALAYSGTTLFAGLDSNGVSRSTDGGKSWGSVNAGLPPGRVISSLAVIGTDIYAGTFGAGVFRSTSNGTVWTAAGLADTSVWSLTASGTTLYAGTGTGVYRTSNGGALWTAVNTGLSDVEIRCLAAQGAGLLASTVIQHIYLSTNSGEAWGPVSLSSSGVDGSFPVAAMKDALFAAGGTWLMGTSTGWLAKSSNAGLSWTLVLYNRVEWLLADGNALYAGTNHSLSTGTPGVFLSTDRGTTWSDITAGLPPPAFQKCPASAFVVAGDRLFAGTRGSGVWRRPLLEVLSTSAIAGGPARQIALHQSYPNPFNGSSDIGFEISDFANVRLQVFDLLGREVALLVNAEKGPGVYHTQWDASGVPSGVYFCRMTTGTFHQTVKMVLSR